MAGFLDGYETVNQKVIRLHATYPTNRIETSIIDWNPEKGYILIECRIYRHYEDEKPAAIDYAHGMVGAYNVQMKRWYVEDTVSSAIGRCASVVLGTETKPSLESMQQVETMPKAFVEDDPWAKPIWDELKSEYQNKTINGYTVLFTEINCSEESAEVEKMMNKYSVEGYPTIKLLKDGQIVEYDAKPSKETLTQFLNTVL
jgi:hypothetical protein